MHHPSHANQLTILLWPFSLALSLQLPHSVHIFTCLLVSFTDPASISIQGLYFPTFVSTRSCIGHAPLTASICVNTFQWTQVHLPSDSILCYPWKTETRLIWKDLGSCLCWVQAWVPLCIWIKAKWGRVAFLSPYFKARPNSGCSSSEDQLPGPRSDARSPVFVFWSKHLSQFSRAGYLKGRVTAWWITVMCHYVSLTFIFFILEPGCSFARKKKILETNHSYKTMPFSNECLCSFGNRGEWLGLST